MPVFDLHVVTFSVPYPPTYGGAMEVWNRIKALHEEGVRIKLHCFLYGAYLPSDRLKEVAQEVYYYPRSVWPVLFTRNQPFVVSSRKQVKLLQRIETDRIPVLFEGMQTTGWIDSLTNRKILLRAHNVEHRYYQQLARHSRGVRAMIFNREAQCLEQYEMWAIPKFDNVFAISDPDHTWFMAQHGNSILLPPFHGFHQSDILPGNGDYLLYQGDLSIEINQRALLELIDWIPDGFALPLVAAGRSGDAAFEAKISGFPNLRREPDVSPEKMIELIRHAQVILVHSLHREGIKMKLFPPLFQGRFIAANQASATNSKIDDALEFYDAASFKTLLHDLQTRPFTEQDLRRRNNILAGLPGDRESARLITQYL